MKIVRLIILASPLLAVISCTARAENAASQPVKVVADTVAVCDSAVVVPVDTIAVDSVSVSDANGEQGVRLTERDYREVAQELGVEVAAIKAVVTVEAGHAHEGFCAPGLPIINFDLSVFKQFARKRGVNLSKYTRSHSVVFARPNTRKYGSYQKAQYARLNAAKQINHKAAIEGTMWGMFQIGGFNWKICGTSSIDEFVKLMSTSERAQLDLFAELIKNTGMLPSLRAKNWSKFASRYNGPAYAKRGYHTKLARAYAKFSRSK